MPPKLSLLPLVSLPPHDFQGAENDDQRIGPEDWAAYWKASLAEAGIDELELAPFGFSCVDARSLKRESTLRRIISSHYADLVTWLDHGAKGPSGALLDNTSSLSGGVVLLVDDEPFVEPGCCASLDDIAGWGALAKHSGPDELTVWAGHDLWSPRGRRDPSSGNVVLRRVGDGYNHGADVEIIEFPPEILEAAVTQTLDDLVALSQRIAATFPSTIDPRKARRVSAHIAGIDERLVDPHHPTPPTPPTRG